VQCHGSSLIQGRRKVWKSGARASRNVVCII
jgi:hypothetical protein